MNLKSFSIQAFRIVLTAVFMLGLIGMPQNGVGADALSVHIVAYPLEDRVQALDWPMDESVTLTIDNPLTPETQDYTAILIVSDYAPWDSNTTIADFQFSGSYNLNPGDLITITGASAIANYVVVSTEIASANLDTDVVYGTAPAGSYVDVTIWIDTGAASSRHVLTNDSGNWSANFAVPGENGEIDYNIQGGEWIGAQQWNDQGHGTAIAWQVPLPPAPPNPRFDVRANTDRVEGWEWTIGETVTLNIDDPGTPDSPDYTCTQVAFIPEDWDTTLVEFDLSGTYDIKPGDEVSLSNDTITKMTTVTGLAITGFDLDADTVSGKAEAFSSIDLWASTPPDWNNVNRHVTADENGIWSANFKEAGEGEQGTTDIGPGVWIDSQQADEYGERTMYGVTVPNPTILANPTGHWVDGFDWPPNTEITLSFGDYSATTTMSTPPFDPNGFYAFFDITGHDLNPGDIVTMTDGKITKTLEIADFAVISLEVSSDTLSGRASPEGAVIACSDNAPGGCRFATARSDGTWSMGPDSAAFVLKPGVYGWAAETDQDGDATRMEWRVPNPRLIASITEDWFRVEDFAPNATLTHKIYSHKGGKLLSEGSVQSDNTGGDLIASNLDLVPGNYIKVTDGSTSKDLVLENLRFDSLKLSDGKVLGSAPPPAGRYIWVGAGTETEYWMADLYTGTDYKWSGNIQAPVPMNLKWSVAQAFDEDGDGTEVRATIILADVAIDIRPWVDRNLFVCGAPGELLPVAVLSTPEFDATTLDAGNVRFGKTGTEATVILVGKDKKPMKVVADVNKDGLPDIVFTFRFGDTGFKCSDISTGQQMTNVNGVLTGKIVTTNDVGEYHIVQNIRIDGTDVLTLVKILGR